jgi:hypothetical protein
MNQDKHALDLTAFDFARKIAGLANIEKPARKALNIFYSQCYDCAPNKRRYAVDYVLSYIEENYKKLANGYPQNIIDEFCERVERMIDSGVFDRIRQYDREGLQEVQESKPQPGL